MMPVRSLPVAVATAALVAALVLPVGVAEANFYRCRVDGREWITNQIPHGQKRHCKLVMKTQDRPADPETDGSGKPAGDGAKKPRRHPITLAPHDPSRDVRRAVMPDERLWSIIVEAAQRYHLPPAFVLAVIKVESNFHPRALSRVGAQGLMQLMPATAASLGVSDSFNPRQNVMGGCKYLRILSNRFGGDMVRTIAAYHAGGGAVDRREGVPYAATEQYVRWVIDRYYEYKALLAGEARPHRTR